MERWSVVIDENINCFPTLKLCPQTQAHDHVPMSASFHDNTQQQIIATPRHVQVGGANKRELLSRLHETNIQLNPLALTLFADDRFTTTGHRATINITVIAIGELGFDAGATFSQIVARAANTGLEPCPLELAPHLRLQFANQPEGFIGQPVSQNCAPPGAITVASAPLSPDDEFLKGFYLRRIEGVLWLRGYRSWYGHVWSPSDRFVFAQSVSAA